MPKCGKVTLSGVTRLDDEQVLTDNDSVLLVDQKLDNFAGDWCIDVDINLDAGLRTRTEVEWEYLVSLDGSNFLVSSDGVADLLVPGLESALADRLCHLGHFYGFGWKTQ